MIKYFAILLMVVAVFWGGYKAAGLARPEDAVVSRHDIALKHIPDRKELQRRINQYGHNIRVDGFFEVESLDAWTAALIDQANRRGEAHIDVITFYLAEIDSNVSNDP